QDQAAQLRLLLQQPVADPWVPDQSQVEHRRERHDPPLRKPEAEQEPELERLVGKAGGERSHKAEPAERTEEIGAETHGPPRVILFSRREANSASPLPLWEREGEFAALTALLRTVTFATRIHSAALRMASHSRSAWASRGETSGYSGSAPTVGRIFQERAHFLPSARRGSTATPGTSSSRKACFGPSPATRLAALVIATSARSTPSSAEKSSRSATWITGAASNEEPMRFCARSVSSAPVTTRRTSRTLRHFSASASLRHCVGTGGKLSRCTEPSGEGARRSPA